MNNFLNIDEFDYKLPPELIAQYPVERRDQSRLIIYRKNTINEDIFANIHKYIGNEYCLVRNNSKVIPARILLKKETGATIEFFCLNPANDSINDNIFSKKDNAQWHCLVKNINKLKQNKISFSKTLNNETITLNAEIKEHNNKDNTFTINFSWNPPSITFGKILDLFGEIPLPPYIKRKSTLIDKDRYQTVYSNNNGSVAAPTAGLHFTQTILNKLLKKGVNIYDITLHVSAGTFKPVKTQNIYSHNMHTEEIIITKSLIENLLNNKQKIICVGTTSLRALESIYHIGRKLIMKQNNPFIVEQWEAYNQIEIPYIESIGAIYKYFEKQQTTFIKCKTSIMIIPKYKFKTTDALITNFHQPRSTLIMLVAAFVGNSWKEIYEYAIKRNFRFFSYGDAMILFRSEK